MDKNAHPAPNDSVKTPDAIDDIAFLFSESTTINLPHLAEIWAPDIGKSPEILACTLLNAAIAGEFDEVDQAHAPPAGLLYANAVGGWAPMRASELRELAGMAGESSATSGPRTADDANELAELLDVLLPHVTGQHHHELACHRESLQGWSPSVPMSRVEVWEAWSREGKLCLTREAVRAFAEKRKLPLPTRWGEWRTSMQDGAPSLESASPARPMAPTTVFPPSPKRQPSEAEVCEIIRKLYPESMPGVNIAKKAIRATIQDDGYSPFPARELDRIINLPRYKNMRDRRGRKLLRD